MDKLKIAHHLKLVLPAEDFILTGTLALHKMGFGLKPKDLDIILVNPKQSTIDILDALETENPPKNLIKYPTPLEYKTIFRFTYDDVEIDVFIHKNQIITETQTQCGLKLASLKHIIEAKKAFGRPKDMLQLLKLSRSIINETEFNNYVNIF
jgi:hypothetical protein